MPWLQPWWRHQMETFSTLLAICAVHRSPVNSLHKGQWRGALLFFFDLRLNKRLSKQSWGWWFETLSRPLWRRCNERRVTFTAVELMEWMHYCIPLFCKDIVIYPSSQINENLASCYQWKRTHAYDLGNVVRPTNTYTGIDWSHWPPINKHLKHTTYIRCLQNIP